MNFDENSSLEAFPSLSALDGVNLPRHRWYHIKESFSPSVVTHALNDTGLKETDIVVDPFTGSGTVMLAAAEAGIPSAGLEVNPFLALVARTKSHNCNPKLLKKNLKDVIEAIKLGRVSPLETYSTFSKSGGRSKWLFNESVLRAFEGGWQATTKKSAPVRDIMRLSLIGAALDVCNAIKDGKCLRYRTNWESRKYDQEAFLAAFEKRVQVMVDDVSTTPLPPVQRKLELGDARSKLVLNGNEKFKLAVMSPPYLNSFDYSDVYRPELFLGKFVRNNDDLGKLRLQTVRSHVQIRWNDPIELDFGTHFVDSLKAVKERSDSLWNPLIPLMIQAYFEDIKLVLSNLLLAARKDASIWLVVSTSSYAGVEIPVDLIIADIGSKAGWYLREVNVVRYLRRVPVQQWNQLSEVKDQHPHLRESLIIFDRKPKGK